MQFGPIDIPDEVIAAQELGELVVFAGAGVSYGGLSKLPLFEGLTDQIGREIHKTRGPGRKDYDFVLGEWHETDGALVHKAAQRIISRPDSQPNDIHHLLLRLFKKPEHVRIVTTNYDRHFSTAAASQLLELTQYCAPALPLGDDFHGVIYLHGSVDDKPERLVLTDADFARAYLTQGWARTFLQALYSKFHVLFVGFSHEDTLLTYLARGLPSLNRRRRYALQIEGDYTRWKQLGISVIPYAPVVGDDSHANLPLGVRLWVDMSRMRPQDVRELVYSIVDGVEGSAVVISGEGAPSAIQLGREGHDFLLRALKEKSSLGWFLNRAHDLRWVRWLHDNGFLPSFAAEAWDKNDRPANEINTMLISWAAGALVRSSKPDVISLYDMLGGCLGPTAWRTVIGNLAGKDSEEAWASPHLDHWLVAVRHGCAARLHFTGLHDLITKLVANARSDHAIGIFAKMLQVRVDWVQQFSLDQPSPLGAEPKLASESYELLESWEALQPLRTPEVDERLLRILISTIEEIYAARGQDRDSVDPITSIRVNVDEPRGPYESQDPGESVLDMILVVLRSRSEVGEGPSEAQILRWLGSAQVGWRRIAYYVLRVGNFIKPELKADIIIQHSLIYPDCRQLYHDPSTLVSIVYGQADVVTKRKLLECIETGPRPSASDDPLVLTSQLESLTRQRNQFLLRVAAVHPTDPELVAILNRLGLRIPIPDESVEEDDEDDDFKPINEIESSPKTVEELLTKAPGEQVEYILNFKGDDAAWARPNRSGLLAAVVAAANKKVDWARQLIESLINRGITCGDVWENLVWGLNWQKQDGDFRRWLLVEMMSKVDPSNWTSGDWNGWTFYLFRLGDDKVLKGLSQEEWNVLLDWSLQAWTAARGTAAEGPLVKVDKDVINKAINHPVGRVVGFWIQYLDYLRSSDPTSPYDWPQKLQTPVAELTADTSDVCVMGLAIIGQFLSFVRYAVPEWTNRMIYPLLDIAQHQRTGAALWTAWLCYGRLSADLAKEMPPFFSQSKSQLLACEKDVSNRFLDYMAAIAVSPLSPSDVAIWIRPILADATPAQRGWWNSKVARSTRNQPTDRQSAVWSGWAREHLRACSLGIWGASSAEEFSGFLHWPIAFTAVADETLALLKELTPPRLNQLNVLHDLKESNLAEEKPDFVAKYLRWLFETVTTDRFGAFWLDDIIKQLRITPQNRADLESLGSRLLLVDQQKGDQLLAKIRATGLPQTP